jgi:hypothetical protein
LHCQPCVWEEWSKKIEKETLLNNALPSPSWHLVWHLGELLNPDVSIPSWWPTDVSNCSVTSLVRITKEKGLDELYLFCNHLPKKKKKPQVIKYSGISRTLKYTLQEPGTDLWIDGTAPMTGRSKGTSRIHSENQGMQIIHNFIHKEANKCTCRSDFCIEWCYKNGGSDEIQAAVSSASGSI